jgi:hypothetical protein
LRRRWKNPIAPKMMMMGTEMGFRSQEGARFVGGHSVTPKAFN